MQRTRQTAEGFANAFIAAIQSRSMDAFKQRFRNTDVLLVDDVQFLMAKAKTEEEFFHTFNALRDIGAQVVLTSDRSPADLAALEERLRDRFASGLVAAIAAPDRATRLTVLRKRVALDHLDVAPAILEFLADRVTSNLRGLEAALVRAVAFASLAQEPLTIELATRVLHDLGPAATTTIGRHAPSVEDVQDATCAAFGLTREELLSSTRAARVAWPRQIAMYLAREHTDVSLPAIGVRFGGRGHTTVMHACKRTSARLAADPEASALVMRLSTQLSTTRPGDHADRPD